MERVWHEEIHAFRRRHDFTTASVTRPWERFSTALAHESVKTGFDDDSFATRKKKKTVSCIIAYESFIYTTSKMQLYY